MEEPYKRLAAELAAAQKLEARANQELLDAKPVNSLSPSLKAAAEASEALDPTVLRSALWGLLMRISTSCNFHLLLQAVYAHQGPEIQRDVAELQRVILDARQILDTATEHLQKASVVC